MAGAGAESGAGEGGGVDIKSLLRDNVLSVRRRLGRDLGSFGVSSSGGSVLTDSSLTASLSLTPPSVTVLMSTWPSLTDWTRVYTTGVCSVLILTISPGFSKSSY